MKLAELQESIWSYVQSDLAQEAVSQNIFALFLLRLKTHFIQRRQKELDDHALNA